MALADDAQLSGQGSGFNSFALVHNLESEAAAETLMSEVIAVGAELVKSPQKVFWGGYSGYFIDPDGHLRELAYNPFEWIGPKDESANS